MNIIALDLGTTTGWAANMGGTLDYESNVLQPEKALKVARKNRWDRKLDPRVPALYKLVKELIRYYRPDLVVFEDVQFIKSTKQGQLWPSLRAAVWLACSTDMPVSTDCLNTGSLKQFATGMRSADKDDMLAALKREDPHLQFYRMDDNIVDAIWLWKWAKKTYRAYEQ